MAVMATTSADATTIAPSAGTDSSAGNGSSPDGALFAALMIQSGVSAGGSSPAQSVAGTEPTTPIRFAVTAGAKAPSDSALEDFAVQIGVDRSLAHLLLTQTGDASAAPKGGSLPQAPGVQNGLIEATAAQTAATSNNANLPQTATVISNLLWSNAQNKNLNFIPHATLPKSAVVKANTPVSFFDGGASSITDLNAVTALSDEDLLKAKSSSRISPKTSSKDQTDDPLSVLQKLSVEAHLTSANKPVATTTDTAKNTSDVAIDDAIPSNLGTSPSATQAANNAELMDGANLPVANPVTPAVTDPALAPAQPGLNYLKAMADVAASGANATVATSPTLSTTVATSPKLSATVAKGQVDHLQNVTVTSSSTDAPVVNDQPGISSEAWLRSLGAANTTLNASTDPTTMGVAASMIDPVANNGLSVATKAGSKAKASAQSVESTSAVATDEPNLTLPNVTIVNAAKVLAGVAEKAQRPSEAPAGGALTSATAVDSTLASGSSLTTTNAASSGSAVDQKAQELLNTPIELPQPDKSYAQRMDDFSAQVASRLMAQIKTEKYSINLKVTPENLGPIAISLTVDGNKLNAHFGAAVPEVNSLLKAALPNLKDNLESQGYNLGTTSFSQSGSGFGAAFGNQTSSGSNASAAVTSVKAASETVPDAPVSVEPSTHVLDVYA